METAIKIKGIGPKTKELLHKLQLYTIKELLFHFPLRYIDKTKITPIADLVADHYGLICAEVIDLRIYKGKKNILNVLVSDLSGSITIVFFNYAEFAAKKLIIGSKAYFMGEIRLTKNGLSINHPKYQVIKEQDEINDLNATKKPLNGVVEENLTPVYSTTKGLYQSVLQDILLEIFASLKNSNKYACEYVDNFTDIGGKWSDLDELFAPDKFISNLEKIHFPAKGSDLDKLANRATPEFLQLAFEELLAHYLSVQQLRALRHKNRAPIITLGGDLENKFMLNLSFTLTNAQKRVVEEIKHDLQQGYAMLRLVQGDVGSGKTVVAALAALAVVKEKGQVAIMVPTELLAQQHLTSFLAWFAPLGIVVGLLSSKVKGKKRLELLENLATQKIDILIGTHAIFQEDVVFKQLMLAVIDEQHRFGVNQRLQLKNKGIEQGRSIHQLIMTATPIPRTLAMTMYSELEISIIDELPPDRLPIKTVAIAQKRREEIIARIKMAVTEGKQVYWVCTLIENSEVLQCEAAQDTFTALSQEFPEACLGLIHGRLKAEEKEQVMGDFVAEKINILIATTVIEVGVNVPNASLMVIENPERLGLAQLHQLRGRVGRGKTQSHCVLLYKEPLSFMAKARLEIMRSTNDGFKIADKDLELRGPGELLGTRQTGEVVFKVADLVRNKDLLPRVKYVAGSLSSNKLIMAVILKRWIPLIKEYAKV